MVIGPRIGKYVNGKPQAMPGHNIPMVVLGTFILAFGWFGFNPGSTLAGTDLRISFVVVNTMLASITGALGADARRCIAKGLKPDPTMMCNGMLAGLVAITAPCAFVDPWAAALIGAIAGVLVVDSVFFFERVRRRRSRSARSRCTASTASGACSRSASSPTAQYGAGWNGVVREAFVSAYGSDGVRGLLYGDASQLVMQLHRLRRACVVFGFVDGLRLVQAQRLITPLRVSAETELEGLDGPEMGAIAYPDFPIHVGRQEDCRLSSS